jgi:hypothetical protein
LVTLFNAAPAVSVCDSACFSPAFIFARWTRGPPISHWKVTLFIKDLCAQALYVQRDE